LRARLLKKSNKKRKTPGSKNYLMHRELVNGTRGFRRGFTGAREVGSAHLEVAPEDVRVRINPVQTALPADASPVR
jgi:hypothetical protein